MKVLVDRACVVSFNLHLGEEWELDSELCDNPVFDLLLGPGLLPTELVAGEGEDLESATLMGTVNLLVL